jgi:hypothetical protein
LPQALDEIATECQCLLLTRAVLAGQPRRAGGPMPVADWTATLQQKLGCREGCPSPPPYRRWRHRVRVGLRRWRRNCGSAGAALIIALVVAASYQHLLFNLTEPGPTGWRCSAWRHSQTSVAN